MFYMYIYICIHYRFINCAVSKSRYLDPTIHALIVHRCTRSFSDPQPLATCSQQADTLTPSMLAQGDNQAQVFWAPWPTQWVFSEANSVHFPVILDGLPHSYTVDLRAAATYNGTILGLRFDPVVTGAPGAWVDLYSITR